jgi:hypothetical protein
MLGWSVLVLVLVALAWPGAAELRRESGPRRSMLGAEPSGSRRVVTEADWAMDLVDLLGLNDALPPDSSDDDRFALLCPDRAELVTQTGGRRAPGRSALRVSAEIPQRQGPTEPVRLVVSVPATALYQLSIEGVGRQRWVLDQRPIGHFDPSSLGIAYAPRLIPLARGPQEISGVLAPKARVDRLELSAHRLLCIAPAAGWKAERTLTHAAMAQTLVHALGLERELPIGDVALPTEGEEFADVSAGGQRTQRRLHNIPTGGAWAKATDGPAEFTYRIHLEEPGLYSLLARVPGGGSQVWSVDGRYRVALRPGGDAKNFGWNHVMSLPLASGEHAIRAFVNRDSGIDLIRLLPHESTTGAYIALAARMGFPDGAPDAPVTRAVVMKSLSHPDLQQRGDDLLWQVVHAPVTSPVVTREKHKDAPPPAAPDASDWMLEPWR